MIRALFLIMMIFILTISCGKKNEPIYKTPEKERRLPKIE
mgnify:CR=1 FL=1